MSSRRLVGIDLGIASAHTVRVLDEAGKTIAKRKAWPTEDFQLARSLVDTPLPEDDLFAGVRETVRT